jgi:hypothetical protein
VGAASADEAALAVEPGATAAADVAPEADPLAIAGALSVEAGFEESAAPPCPPHAMSTTLAEARAQ